MDCHQKTFTQHLQMLRNTCNAILDACDHSLLHYNDSHISPQRYWGSCRKGKMASISPNKQCLVLSKSSHKYLHMLMCFGKSEPWGCDLFLLIICSCWLSASRFLLSLAVAAAVVVWSWGVPLFCGLLATKYRRECQEECHHWKG